MAQCFPYRALCESHIVATNIKFVALSWPFPNSFISFHFIFGFTIGSELTQILVFRFRFKYQFWSITNLQPQSLTSYLCHSLLSMEPPCLVENWHYRGNQSKKDWKNRRNDKHTWHSKRRGGRNVEFHYYNKPFFSLHRKWLFSWSLLRHHYIQNGFLVDHYYDITTSKVPF